MSSFISSKPSAQKAAQSQQTAPPIIAQEVSRPPATDLDHGTSTMHKSAPVNSWVHAVAGGLVATGPPIWIHSAADTLEA